MSAPLIKRFDVTGTVPGLSESLTVAAWIFPAQGDTKGVWFCLPGGSYTKAYYHLLVPGLLPQTYSFALHMARQGFLIVAIDHLGTGESTHPEGGDELITSARIVAANYEVVRQINVGLLAGTLHPDLPVFSSPLPLFGIGHSWGGKLLLMQEDAYHCFNAIALAGWSNCSISFAGAETGLAQAAGIDQQESPEETIRQVASNFSPEESRMHMLGFFVAPDVPREVIVADTALATSFPIGVLREDPNPALMQPIAKRIRIPIFLCLSSLVDVSTDLEQEAATYPPGLVFSYALPGSHHCHNFASSRELFWTLLDGWARGILKHYHS